MTDGLINGAAVLPDDLRRPLLKLSPPLCAAVQEIRLRAGQAVSVGIRGEEHFLTADGTLTDRAGGAVHCTAAQIRYIVDRACEHSVYAHQEELRHGYLPAPSGCRLGVAGTAVVEHGRVVSYRDITSLCLRIARDHRGCARTLAERLCANGVCGALIGGEPSSGKTALLRDLLREFTARRLSVTAVDERGELTGTGVWGCDVLRCAPKPAGIEQAVRCLSPRVVVFDELGTAELQAVRAAVTCGVPVVASVHCRTLEELYLRDGVAPLLAGGAFTYLVQLRGSAAPGAIARIVTTEEWWNETAGYRTAVDERRGLWYRGAP